MRSRLSEAKRRLDGILLHSAADHWEHRRRAAAERHRIEHAVAEVTRHRPEPFTAEVSHGVRLAFRDGSVLRGRDRLAAAVENDLAAGISFRLTDVHSAGITIIEGQFDNPADDPAHCPPTMTQIRLGPRGDHHADPGRLHPQGDRLTFVMGATRRTLDGWIGAPHVNGCCPSRGCRGWCALPRPHDLVPRRGAQGGCGPPAAAVPPRRSQHPPRLPPAVGSDRHDRNVR